MKKQEIKSIFKSRTLWFNVLALIVMVASNFGFEMKPTQEVNEIAGIIIALINFGLRFFTKLPIK
jgi:hypothetical protein